MAVISAREREAIRRRVHAAPRPLAACPSWEDPNLSEGEAYADAVAAIARAYLLLDLGPGLLDENSYELYRRVCARNVMTAVALMMARAVS